MSSTSRATWLMPTSRAMPARLVLVDLAERLAAAGFVAADEEAEELLARADGDEALLDALVARRLTGEPLAWITGHHDVLRASIRVRSGRLRAALAHRAARAPRRRAPAHRRHRDRPVHRLRARWPRSSGGRPDARVVGSDVDERAVACARANGVTAYRRRPVRRVPADLQAASTSSWRVVPYVPTPELRAAAPRHVRLRVPRSYDGGADGAGVLRRARGREPAVPAPRRRAPARARRRRGRRPARRPGARGLHRRARAPSTRTATCGASRRRSAIGPRCPATATTTRVATMPYAIDCGFGRGRGSAAACSGATGPGLRVHRGL